MGRERKHLVGRVIAFSAVVDDELRWAHGLLTGGDIVLCHLLEPWKLVIERRRLQERFFQQIDSITSSPSKDFGAPPGAGCSSAGLTEESPSLLLFFLPRMS